MPRPLSDASRKLRYVLLDRRGPELEMKLEARVEGGELLERERDHLEAAGIGKPGRVVIHQARKVLGRARGHPTHRLRLELRDELGPDIDEARAPRPGEPLLRAACEDVDRRAGDVERQRPQPLDRIDDEVDAALTA